MPEAMKKIREELGRDAVILNSKIVYSKGFLGLFRKKNIEVVAAIDEQISRESDHKPIVTMNNDVINQSRNLLDDSNIARQSQNEQLLTEIHQLQNLVKQLTNFRSINFDQIPEPYHPVFQRLVQQQIEPNILEKLKEKTNEHYYKNDQEITEEDATVFIGQLLLDAMDNIDFGGMSLEKKYINVVGPTGVGKTTTLAKMAANAAIQLKKKIAFITTDTYRIAAVDQLKTYAKILNVPIEVCYNNADFKKAIETFQDYDYIFIDTAGRNFRNQVYVHELKKMIDFDEDMETFLVFSLTSKEIDMDEIYAQFSLIPIDKFIFTKLDETTLYGAMINQVLKYNKGIAYITNGQEVPDDIVEATPEFIIQKVFGEKL